MLPPDLRADYGLEVAHHHRVRVRACHGADHIEGFMNGCDPVTHRLVHGIFKRCCAGGNRSHGSPEQLHPEHVLCLTMGVFFPHEYFAAHSEQGCNRSCRHAMHAGAGFGYDPGFSHPPGQESLTDSVVYFMRPGMIQIFALQINACATTLICQFFGKIERIGTTNVLAQIICKFLFKFLVIAVMLISLLQFQQSGHECFRDITPAVLAKVTVFIG